VTRKIYIIQGKYIRHFVFKHFSYIMSLTRYFGTLIVFTAGHNGIVVWSTFNIFGNYKFHHNLICTGDGELKECLEVLNNRTVAHTQYDFDVVSQQWFYEFVN